MINNNRRVGRLPKRKIEVERREGYVGDSFIFTMVCRVGAGIDSLQLHCELFNQADFGIVTIL